MSITLVYFNNKTLNTGKDIIGFIYRSKNKITTISFSRTVGGVKL